MRNYQVKLTNENGHGVGNLTSFHGIPLKRLEAIKADIKGRYKPFWLKQIDLGNISKKLNKIEVYEYTDWYKDETYKLVHTEYLEEASV